MSNLNDSNTGANQQPAQRSVDVTEAISPQRGPQAAGDTDSACDSITPQLVERILMGLRLVNRDVLAQAKASAVDDATFTMLGWLVEQGKLSNRERLVVEEPASVLSTRNRTIAKSLGDLSTVPDFESVGSALGIGVAT